MLLFIYKLKNSKEICFVDYFFVGTMLRGIKSYTFGKPAYPHLNGAASGGMQL